MFKKYPSLINHYQTGTIEKILSNNPDLKECLWVATEKAHGCNIAIQFSPNMEHRACSRNKYCSNDFERLGEALSGDKSISITNLATHIFRHRENIEFVWIYGELIGEGLQKGVKYTKGREFVVFDVCFKYKDSEDRVFLSYDELMALCDEFRVISVKPVCVGSFDECMAYDNEFNSLIAHDLGNDYEDNICEGIVLRPFTFYLSDSFWPVVKKKNDKFLERSKSKEVVKSERVLDEEVKNAIELGSSMVCSNRLDSAESKLGKIVETSQIGEFMKEVTSDIRNELLNEEGIDLTEKQKKEVMKFVGNLVAKALKERIMENGLNSCS